MGTTIMSDIQLRNRWRIGESLGRGGFGRVFEAQGEDGTAAELDLLKLEEAERKRSEFEMRQRQAHFSNLYRERELDLKERKHALAEKGFQLQREKARANFQELERKATAGESLTPDDLRRVREIYGLYEEPTTATAIETRRAQRLDAVPR